ncbi:hypothetical protein FOA43_002483 [Brettanomyces nanus]|uniref:GRIP domain-containing protein n=1 Tax=Eeniella nana TaxID=13502 RepID=A0A875S5W5_EENNA|nr:uncharacterized protein FOA43_002483 [Brettanomyces nanus]QPG75139.1 hypothetical protein FOA43_002483 [Brettanomyces nanus]
MGKTKKRQHQKKKVKEEDTVKDTTDEATETEKYEEVEEAEKAEEIKVRLKKLQLESDEKDQRIIDQKSEETLEQKLQQKEEECEKVKENYQNLLDRLSSMKTVFTKMKTSEIEFHKTKEQVLKLEKDKIQLEKKVEKVEEMNQTIIDLQKEMNNINLECEKLTRENNNLRKGSEIKDGEFLLENKRLQTANKKLMMELQESKSEMEEYLIIINEEKMSKQGLQHEIDEINLKNERSEAENKRLIQENQSLEKKVAEIEGEVTNIKQQHSKEHQELKNQLDTKVIELSESHAKVEDLQKLQDTLKQKSERLESLEQDFKQKQKTIGKLRHETIVLNEHLTKAMKLIKQESSQDTIDRELASNLFVSFLQIPRGDSKKYEVLQLISNYLNWDDTKKKHAGLLNSNQKTNSNSVMDSSANRLNTNRSFVSLWTDFLEKESTPHK